MPKRTDINRIMIVSSGPIVIGQACEFDYSGTQACKALRADGFTVILVNSNPATIMTDPELADRTYVEPITADMVEKIIAKEKPDALLPTLGGQTGLNCAMELADRGVLDRYGVELIGATRDAIRKAEDRKLFKETMLSIGLDVPRSRTAGSEADALAAAEELGFPLVLRPAFTLGGTGGSIAWNAGEFREKVRHGLEWSPIRQVLVEESVVGWKEFELEVMRDRKNNNVVVCSIENFDPMGIHTGDSITVAPAQTLTDREYQRMRDAAFAIMNAIGVETGGSNIQFAVHPGTGRMVVIEMNPRVSRSSALASKATGFPIAKIAAKLAVGYTLDELPNDITKSTPASFEPSIDYVVVKVPRFAFEKFPDTGTTLDTQMRSVGEAMAIARTFPEALQKALRSLENDTAGFVPPPDVSPSRKTLADRVGRPHPNRILHIREALEAGFSVEELHDLTSVDPWFLRQLAGMAGVEGKCRKAFGRSASRVTRGLLLEAKRAGTSDRQIADWMGVPEAKVSARRRRLGVRPGYKMVDTCAGEFAAATPYLYSTYESATECPPSRRAKVAILGSGPNRIGQGVEFDYCCVHAAYALREESHEVIMVNCNPETVSTDYDTSDRLYFEPLTGEDVLEILDRERPLGVILQLGGQTPLKLAKRIEAAGFRILGTSPDSIDVAEDRRRFEALLNRLRLDRPQAGTARSVREAAAVAKQVGYPVLVRPSYVLGGRAMEIVYDEEQLSGSMGRAILVSPEHPVLVDKFLEDAIEVDVDCVADGRDVVIPGIMEHIEEAGIHSGDSAMVLPPHTLSAELVERIRRHTRDLALALKVKGLMNVQYAVKNDQVFVLEVNPRASRTVPFVSKVTGRAWAKVATKVMLGKTLRQLGALSVPAIRHVGVKESVFPFDRFEGADILLGPEMKSTGEVMGADLTFGPAFAKSQLAAGAVLPLQGGVFISVRNREKRGITFVAKSLEELGFRLFSTEGTAHALRQANIRVTELRKLHEGVRPNVLDHVQEGKIQLVINIPGGKRPRDDSPTIRKAAIRHRIPVVTTLAGAQALASALESMKATGLEPRALQDYYDVPPPKARAA